MASYRSHFPESLLVFANVLCLKNISREFFIRRLNLAPPFFQSLWRDLFFRAGHASPCKRRRLYCALQPFYFFSGNINIFSHPNLVLIKIIILAIMTATALFR